MGCEDGRIYRVVGWVGGGSRHGEWRRLCGALGKNASRTKGGFAKRLEGSKGGRDGESGGVLGVVRGEDQRVQVGSAK